jgi:hypothetical protein
MRIELSRDKSQVSGPKTLEEARKEIITKKVNQLFIEVFVHSNYNSLASWNDEIISWTEKNGKEVNSIEECIIGFEFVNILCTQAREPLNHSSLTRRICANMMLSSVQAIGMVGLRACIIAAIIQRSLARK